MLKDGRKKEAGGMHQNWQINSGHKILAKIFSMFYVLGIFYDANINIDKCSFFREINYKAQRNCN